MYKNGTLEFFNHAEGIVEFEADGYKYVYQFKDHLGNIRLSYKDADKDGSISTSEIIQEKNYYPFGLQMRGINETLRGRNHNYGYNGKEEQDELDFNTLDYGARFYDPGVGRWFTPDALAEKYYSTSPYNYALNNPILYIDPDGNQVEMCCEKLQGFLAGMIDNTFGTNLRSGGNTQKFQTGVKQANGASLAIATILLVDGAVSTTAGGGGLIASGAAASTGVGAPVGGIGAAASGGLLAKGAVELTVGGVMMANTISNMQEDAQNGNSNSSSGNNNSSGESSVSKDIHNGKQGKHVEGHNNYQEGKSTITEDPQSLLDDFHNGSVESSSAINDTKTRVNFGKKIGNYINPETGEATSTTNGIIHNSKKGAHIVPSRPNL
ncbi:polymorphic toxin type 50 domain-containing protein [Aquimarina sp. AU58]|uniref:polymorphic toxin type 50 domain-containing protein n=1 Tax=Aquimarina sp. AU58 TaxID=1874112 RepID=UPI000D6E892E|nr:polymorphic toxin type 50 domain-containing protein [Aquimarina sp. AU58]